jgi:hypothetical protein
MNVDFVENLETMTGETIPLSELATVGECLEAASIQYLIGARKLAVCNHLESTPARILQRIGSGDCRDVRTIAAILAVYGLGLAVVDAAGRPLVRYAPFALASVDALKEYQRAENARTQRKRKEEGQF